MQGLNYSEVDFSKSKQKQNFPQTYMQIKKMRKFDHQKQSITSLEEIQGDIKKYYEERLEQESVRSNKFGKFQELFMMLKEEEKSKRSKSTVKSQEIYNLRNIPLESQRQQ
mmetsp:Transcript_3445/g.3403  ORF Transcript_3445/g.3403 Transcript_3445/m.3403 type:complete len:111 (+) Transcript_3445:199-531(+)